MRALTLAVVCSLLLAGCNAGPTPATASGGEGTATLTPAPVPDQTAGAADLPALPPGVNASGIENATALAAAHDAALRNRSYVLSLRRNAVERTSGSVGRWTLRLSRVAVENDTVYAGRVNRLEDWPGWSYRTWDNRTLYADGSVEFVRIERFDGYNYTRRPLRPASSLRTQTADDIRRHVENGPATVSVVQRSGRRLLRIDTRDAPRNAGESSIDRNIGTVLFVDSQGIVYQLDSHGRGPGGDGSSQWVTYSFSYVQIGGVGVDEPAWLAEARTRTSFSRYRPTASGEPREGRPCLSSGRVAFIGCESE